MPSPYLATPYLQPPLDFDFQTEMTFSFEELSVLNDCVNTYYQHNHCISEDEMTAATFARIKAKYAVAKKQLMRELQKREKEKI